MEKGIFVATSESFEELSELTKSVLNDLSMEENSKEISDNILSLEFSKQLLVINDIINNLYSLTDRSKIEIKTIEKFLIQKEFKPHREILVDIFFDEGHDGLSRTQLLELHEKTHNIVIDLSKI